MQISVKLLLVAVLAGASSLCSQEAPKPDTKVDPGFVSIFNGEDLTGWDGEERYWRIEDGAITGETTEDNPVPYNKFIIWDEGELDDFELKLNYKITSGNSGIQIRSFRKNPERPYSIQGYQADLDAARGWAGTNYGEGFGGVLAKRGEKTILKEKKEDNVVESIGDAGELQAAIKENDWNEYHIVAKGNNIQQFINGKLMSDVTDERPNARSSGLLALQLHGGPPMKVQFKDIQLKRTKLEEKKKIVFFAGLPSHRAGDHEHNAGCLLLARLLNENYGDKIQATVYTNGWPADTTAIQNADALVMYSDGQTRHVGWWHRRQLTDLAKKGVGIGCIHYAVEMKPDDSNKDLISWIGGAFEINYSVNPHWDAEFKQLPDHAVANGVEPFTINDEWYFNMRFAEENVTPILSAIPPESTMERKDGHHSGNPTVRKMVADKLPQHVCWVYDREDGGRGFGFTGGHRHVNWQDDNHRKTALNAIAWIAGVEIPENGIETPTPNDEEMAANLDPKKKR
ncbi:MAG: DUF1080 domain-containing protein [Verrucomicrobiota bacterium]